MIFGNAKICYEKAATINHDEYLPKYNLAQIALIYRDLDKAEEYFTICLYSDALESKAYFELADIYNFKTIECCINDEIRTIDDINDELFNYVIDYIKKETNN